MLHHPRGRKDGRARLPRRRPRRAPIFELLEDRVVPTIFVGSTADLHHYGLGVTPAQLADGQDLASGNSDASITLLDAITAADNSPGTTSIVLQSQQVYALTQADNAWYGPDGLPPVTSQVAIQGNGATIARSSTASTFRLFYVGGGGVLTLTDVTLTGGLAQGGAGGDGETAGGGGGAGLGGAIFDQGSLTLNSVTIDQNQAIGGNGGNGFGNSGTPDSGGGGGGLGGSGGSGGLPNGVGSYVGGGGGGGGFLTNGSDATAYGGNGGAFLGDEGGNDSAYNVFPGRSPIGGDGATGIVGGGGGGALPTDDATSAVGAGAGHAAGLAGGNGGGALPSAGGGAFGGGGGGELRAPTRSIPTAVAAASAVAAAEPGPTRGPMAVLLATMAWLEMAGSACRRRGRWWRHLCRELRRQRRFRRWWRWILRELLCQRGRFRFRRLQSLRRRAGVGSDFNLGGLGGGGGAGLGGAIFVQGGVVVVDNSTLTANNATGGGGRHGLGSGGASTSGEGHVVARGLAGAIFNLDGNVTLINDTVVGNTATGIDPNGFDSVPYFITSGGDVYNLAQGVDAGGNAFPATLTLTNNIIGTLYNAQTSTGSATVNAADPNIVESSKSPSPATLIGHPTVYAAELGPLTPNAGGPATLPITDSTIEYFLYDGVTTQKSANSVTVPLVDERGFSRAPVPFLGASQPATLVAISSPDSGAYTYGQTVDITVTYTEPVTVSGVATILVQTSATTTAYATYLSGSGTDQLTFAYAVAPHDNIEPFDYTSFNPLQGNIVDLQGVPVSLAVPLHSTNADGLYIRGITLLPDYVYTVSGGGQSAEIGSPYPAPLVVTVTDPSVLDGNGQPTPVSGVLVSFRNLKPGRLELRQFLRRSVDRCPGADSHQRHCEFRRRPDRCRSPGLRLPRRDLLRDEPGLPADVYQRRGRRFLARPGQLIHRHDVEHAAGELSGDRDPPRRCDIRGQPRRDRDPRRDARARHRWLLSNHDPGFDLRRPIPPHRPGFRPHGGRTGDDPRPLLDDVRRRPGRHADDQGLRLCRSRA